MTARGTVFLALEDETGMVNVTLWPDAWARLRGVVRRHALLLVDGTLQREGEVVNVIARDVQPLPEATASVGGPARPPGRPPARHGRDAPDGLAPGAPAALLPLLGRSPGGAPAFGFARRRKRR